MKELKITQWNADHMQVYGWDHFKKHTENNPSSMAIFDKKLRSIANTIKSGMDILGVDTPERM